LDLRVRKWKEAGEDYVMKRFLAQWYSAGLRAGRSGVRVPAGAGNFFLHHHVQTDSGAHPASYLMGTTDSFHGSKAAGA
jgi:hypothetical protein